MASSRTSATLMRLNGTARSTGSSQAIALTSAMTAGGKGPRPARPVPVSQARQALREEALAPLQCGVRRDAQALGDLLVLPTLRGCKYDPSPQHLPLLGLASAQTCLQHPALVRGEHDLKRAAPTRRTSKIRLARGQIRRRLHAGTYKAKY
jgi:hypothetical protein